MHPVKISRVKDLFIVAVQILFLISHGSPRSKGFVNSMTNSGDQSRQSHLIIVQQGEGFVDSMNNSGASLFVPLALGDVS